jgi:hypothetical protein
MQKLLSTMPSNSTNETVLKNSGQETEKRNRGQLRRRT